MSCLQRALRSASPGAVAEFCAMAELINPAVATTARAMVERMDTERISLLADGHDLETPDHGRLHEDLGTRSRKADAVLEISYPPVRRLLSRNRLHTPVIPWSSMSCPV